mmetsp:Transcript_46325/g.121551  ORF Transcript_46325/g.121551 Transcript_46325/m.121551 type:complete len:294 (-) Transcript_46325:1083-1964(-)
MWCGSHDSRGVCRASVRLRGASGQSGSIADPSSLYRSALPTRARACHRLVGGVPRGLRGLAAARGEAKSSAGADGPATPLRSSSRSAATLASAFWMRSADGDGLASLAERAVPLALRSWSSSSERARERTLSDCAASALAYRFHAFWMMRAPRDSEDFGCAEIMKRSSSTPSRSLRSISESSTAVMRRAARGQRSNSATRPALVRISISDHADAVCVAGRRRPVSTDSPKQPVCGRRMTSSVGSSRENVISDSGVISTDLWPVIEEVTITSPASRKNRSRDGSPRRKTTSPFK